MYEKERNETTSFLVEPLFLLFAIAVMGLSASDIYNDISKGQSGLHLILEGLILLLAGLSFVWAINRIVLLKSENSKLKVDLTRIDTLAKEWRERTLSYSEGLSKAIDEQLDKWNLTPAEKDVALLLLKGLTLKEIADIRKTGERTVRQQSQVVYAKSGLTGRAELAAFFLEDLLG